jgi:SAM-dependent methyltransferase
MPQTDRRRAPRKQVSLPVHLVLNGTELEAVALDISAVGVFVLCSRQVLVAERLPIRTEVVTDAGVLHLPGTWVGSRDPNLSNANLCSLAGFGFAIRFEPLDVVTERVFDSMLESLSDESLMISLRLHGFDLPEVCSGQAEVRSSDRELRLMPRVKMILPVLVRAQNASGITEEQTSTVNLSATGACLELTGEPRPLGGRLVLQLALPPLLRQKMQTQKTTLETIVGQIMWMVPISTGGEGASEGLNKVRVGLRLLPEATDSRRKIAGLIAQLFIGGERCEESQIGATITTEVLEYRTEMGQRIAAYLDCPKDPLPNSPVVIVAPGYGVSKQRYVTLGYYLAANGFHVVRYDHCDHVGESDGDSTGTTLAGFGRDLETVLTFVKEAWPSSPVGVIATGLAGRVALKTAGKDRRIDLLVVLAGIWDLQQTCLAVHQEDLLVMFLRGSRRGVSNLLGLDIDVDRFMEDAIKEGYADLRTSLRDAQGVQIPVIFFAADKEVGGCLSAVNEVRAALGRPDLSEVQAVPQPLQQLHESPGKEWAMFRQLVARCRIHLAPGSSEREVLEPHQMEIGRQNRLERQRAKAQSPMGKGAAVDFWRDYLGHFHCLANIPEYWHLLDEIARLLRMPEKGGCILDAGCGPGNFGMLMLLNDLYRMRATPGAAPQELHYVGLERVPSALARACLNFSNLKNNSVIQPSLTCADLNRALPFRDNQFDRIVCNLVLGYLEDPVFSLQELMRVLVPGGRIIITSLKPYADLIEISRNFVLRTDLPEEVEEAERLLNTACKIKQAESDGLFRSFQPHELTMLLMMSGATQPPEIHSTFANQAFITVGEKPAETVPAAESSVTAASLMFGAQR